MKELVKKYYERKSLKEYLTNRLLEINNKISLCKDAIYMKVLINMRDDIMQQLKIK